MLDRRGLAGSSGQNSLDIRLPTEVYDAAPPAMGWQSYGGLQRDAPSFRGWMQRCVSCGRKWHETIEVPEPTNLEEISHHRTSALGYCG
jgi:hypothetical protein